MDLVDHDSHSRQPFQRRQTLASDYSADVAFAGVHVARGGDDQVVALPLEFP
jgi:hypothetical protein